MNSVQKEARELGSALAAFARERWIASLALLALVAALYAPTFAWILNAWRTNDYYGHGFIVAPLTLLFLWRARQAVKSREANPGGALTYVPALLAVALYALGFRYHEPFLFALSLVVLAAAIPVFTMGWRKAAPMLPPIGLLLFAIPIPNLIYVGYLLQHVATTGTGLLLALFRVPFRQDDFTIYAGTLHFEVAPLCSGLSSVVSILLLATVVSALAPLSGGYRALLTALSVPIAIIANVVRITLTIAVGLRFGPAVSEGFFHGFSSFVLFVLALAAVLALSRAFVFVQGRRTLHA